MRVLVAPDAFKGTLSARQVADAIRAGLRRTLPEVQTEICPLADGGEGSSDILAQALGGVQHNVWVQDPLGRMVNACFGFIDSTSTAIVEVAQASGLTLLSGSERNPLGASSFGTGELIGHALDGGAKQIWVCLGGSATVDGGLGLLSALGAQGFDDQMRPVSADGQGLINLAQLDTTQLDPRLKTTEITALCDVDNALCGPHGAQLFMAQKGANAHLAQQLDTALNKWSRVLRQLKGSDVKNLPGAGAAGGMGAGLAGALGARLVSGADFILDCVNIDATLRQADWVISGEGRLDEQSAHGKVVASVARRAANFHVPVVAVCGSSDLSPAQCQQMGIRQTFAIAPHLASAEQSLHRPEKWLKSVAVQAGEWLGGQSDG